MPEPPAEAVQTAADGQPVLIEPRTSNIVGAIIKLRQIEDAYLYTIRLVDPEVIRARQIVTANTSEYRRAGGKSPHHADRLCPALSRPDPDHRAVGDLDRHRCCRPACPADPSADRRRRRGRDWKSRRFGSRPSFRRRRRFARRHVQQDASGTEVAAQRNPRPPRISSTKGAGFRRPCLPVSPRASSASIPMASSPSSTARRKPCWRFRRRLRSARTFRRYCRMSGRVYEIGRKSGRPVYREQVTFYRAGAERTFNVQVTIEGGNNAL